MQQLGALAGLHARIRHRQPLRVSQRHVAPGGVMGHGHRCWAHGPGSQLSPLGDYALVLSTDPGSYLDGRDWEVCSAEMRSLEADAGDFHETSAVLESLDTDADADEDTDEDDAVEPSSLGAYSDTDEGGRWPHPGRDAFSTCAVGWSPIGSVCVVAAGIRPEPHALYHSGLGIRPDSDSASDSEPDSEPGSPRAPAEPPAVICVFDSVQCKWLHERPLPGVLPDNSQTIKICDSATLPVTAFCGHTVADHEAVLIVFQVTTSRMHLVPLLAERRCSRLWLPGSHTLVLLQADRLAWLDVLTISSDSHSADWSALPETSVPQSHAMAACPHGQALWVVQGVGRRTGGDHFCVSVHTPAHRACLGTWSLDIPGADCRYLHVVASCQALAVGADICFTCIYSLHGPTTLGQPLFSVREPLRGLAFSGDGCFLVADNRAYRQIEVLETSTGAIVTSITLPDGRHNNPLYTHTAAWGMSPNQLLVSSVPSEGRGSLWFNLLEW